MSAFHLNECYNASSQFVCLPFFLFASLFIAVLLTVCPCYVLRSGAFKINECLNEFPLLKNESPMFPQE